VPPIGPQIGPSFVPYMGHAITHMVLGGGEAKCGLKIQRM